MFCCVVGVDSRANSPVVVVVVVVSAGVVAVDVVDSSVVAPCENALEGDVFRSCPLPPRKCGTSQPRLVDEASNKEPGEGSLSNCAVAKACC